jgi:hypothetical protein
MKNFARIIPAEAIAAYTTLTAVAATLTVDPTRGMLVVAWACLIGTFLIRLLTSQDPDGAQKMQLLPAVGAALAFSLYVYSQGNDLGPRFGVPAPAEGEPDNLKTWASILVGLWAAFAPIIVPRLIALIRRRGD